MFQRIKAAIVRQIVGPDPDPQPSNLDVAEEVRFEFEAGARARNEDEAMVMALGALECKGKAQAVAVLDGFLSTHPLTPEDEAAAPSREEVRPVPGLYDQVVVEALVVKGFADKIERDLHALPAATVAAIVRGEQ